MALFLRGGSTCPQRRCAGNSQLRDLRWLTRIRMVRNGAECRRPIPSSTSIACYSNASRELLIHVQFPWIKGVKLAGFAKFHAGTQCLENVAAGEHALQSAFGNDRQLVEILFPH